jgi:hypothetical protein
MHHFEYRNGTLYCEQVPIETPGHPDGSTQAAAPRGHERPEVAAVGGVLLYSKSR